MSWKISPLEGGLSKQTFLVQNGSKKFVLRKFQDKKTAELHVKVVKSLERFKIVPKLIAKHDNLVLLEFISGRVCTKEDSVAFQVGKICGLINNLKIKVKYNIDTNFFKHLQIIKNKKLITVEESVKVKKLYLHLKRKLKPKNSIDANDVYPANFKVWKGRVFMVDIEGIKPRLKGRGIAKAFSRWFKTSEKQKKFWKGYTSVASNSFWTKKYELLAMLYFLVPSISYGADPSREIKIKDIRKLKLLLKNYTLT